MIGTARAVGSHTAVPGCRDTLPDAQREHSDAVAEAGGR